MKPSQNNVHITEVLKLTFRSLCMWKSLSKWEKKRKLQVQCKKFQTKVHAK